MTVMFLQDLYVIFPLSSREVRHPTHCVLFSTRQYVFVMKVGCTRQTCSEICAARSSISVQGGSNQMCRVTAEVLPSITI